jgi:hypothetical protein
LTDSSPFPGKQTERRNEKHIMMMQTALKKSRTVIVPVLGASKVDVTARRINPPRILEIEMRTRVCIAPLITKGTNERTTRRIIGR